MSQLVQMLFQTVTIFGSISTVLTAEWVDISMRFHVTVEHGFINTAVIALTALEWLRTHVIAQMVLQMVFVFSDKGAKLAVENFIFSHMRTCMCPKFNLKKMKEKSLLKS